MELEKDNKQSWMFCISEALEVYMNRLDMCQHGDVEIREEIETAMKWIEEELHPLLSFTDEKIKLMQDKNLLYRLEMMILKGSNRLAHEETSQISDMILSRKGKKSDLIDNIDDGIDLDKEKD